MFKFRDETPFQKWMKLQGGKNVGTVGDTADPDNMMKAMANGPILFEDLNRKKDHKGGEGMRSKSTCDVDWIAAKE